MAQRKCWTKEACQPSQRKEGIGGRWTHWSTWKFGQWVSYFENTPGVSHTQANIVPGDQQKKRSLARPSGLEPALGWCTGLSSPWLLRPQGPWPPWGSLSHSLTDLVIHLPVCSCALWPGVCDLVALAAAWPVAVPAPHMASRNEPQMGNSQEQPKLPGWPLSSYLWAPNR